MKPYTLTIEHCDQTTSRWSWHHETITGYTAALTRTKELVKAGGRGTFVTLRKPHAGNIGTTYTNDSRLVTV